MSQASDAEANGPVPTDVGPRPGPYEGVKVAPGNNSSPQPSTQTAPIVPQPGGQQYYQQPSQQNQQLQNFPQRPPIRRTDSRSNINYRPPFPNQVPVQQPIGGARPPPQLQPRPPPPGGNFPPRPVQRFPAPQQQQQQQPIRYQYDPQQPGQEVSFRRAVNSMFTRPPVPGPRPGIFPQKSLPQQPSIPPDPIKKSYTLDNSEVQLAHSVEEQNGAKKIDLPEKHSKYDDIRSSSSLGFNHDEEKDIDTALNGKSNSREEISDRPESRTGFLSRDHSSHSSMLKIDEDDDDAVMTPSRTAFTSGSMRSGKSSISNSSDNISQKSLDIKPDITKPSMSPEVRKMSTPPKRNSTDNISLKNLDIDSSNVRTSSPLPPEEIKKASSPVPPPTRMTSEAKPATLTPQEKIARTPSPVAPMKQDTPRSATPELRQVAAKPQILSPTTPSPLANKEPVKKAASPRVESKSIVGGRRTPRLRKEGDNDSGVDESTQGNDRSLNGEQSSPRKTPNKVSSSKLPTNKCKTPTKMLQSPKSPDPANSMLTSTEKKKLPMNKVQVGSAPSPNIKQVKSKIGSLDNTSYKPGGGKVKLENRKIDFSKVQPKIAAKNDQYQPGGGDKKSHTVNSARDRRPTSASYLDEIQQQKLQWNAKSKIGSLDNSTYKPGGGDKKIETVKLDFKDKAKPKVGSKDNIKHTPGGGEVKSLEEELQNHIETKKIELNVSSKVGSLDNVKHRPGGGDIKIFDDKDYLRQMTSGEQSVLSGSQEYDDYEITSYTTAAKKRSQSVKPPTSLNIASPSPRRRVRYLDLHGPQSLVDSPQQKSIDYQRPMSACSNIARKKSKLKVSFTLSERPPWRY